MYTSALTFASASVVTAVFSSAPVFVFILSYFILNEFFTLLKLFAVLCSILGVVLIAYSQGFHSFSIIGVSFATGSAILAALYKVNLKKVLGEAGMAPTAVYLGLLGAINMFIFWPIIILLDVLGVEAISTMEVPWSTLVLHSVGYLFFNSFVNYGIIYTSPLFISIGTIIGIPLSILADFIFRAGSITLFQICGSASIAVGFILLIIAGTESRDDSI